ncbi:MAG: glycosyltransferase family 2 protein [Pseudanabaenaceae cyanobacterium bins.68]|nr:glycosyltransferase family 2 protein [Pseudanabaenaceae cyanobacterium bins.68]
MLYLLLFQLPFVAILLQRLSTAPRRIPALTPLQHQPQPMPRVSVVIPTLNEIERLPHCLAGLAGQAATEVIVVDSRSQDGTPEYVLAQQPHYQPPLRLVTDDPLPPNWVGRPWALHNGYLAADPQNEWVLGIDADTLPQPGLVASFLQGAIAGGYDMVSLSPRFILKYPGEQWLQPALLITLIYRFGATGDPQQFQQDRVMANGQCFLSKRSLLDQLHGYELAKSSFCDDVTLARAAAQSGAKVGFLDGANLIQVRMYTSMAETWKEWGRSLDLKDAATPMQTWSDCLFLLAVQGLPLPTLILLVFLAPLDQIFAQLLLGINGFLLLIRLGLNAGIKSSYTTVGLWYWLSPLADPLAVLRIWLSAATKPKQWRGRTYS